MFVTVLYDVYSPHESGVVARALSELCNPFDNYGWSSAAVYLFWDPTSKAPLYIGYSLNFPRRFCEHNGLVPCDPDSCKTREIDHFFEEGHAEIAVSLIAQSASATIEIPKKDVTAESVLFSPVSLEKEYVTDIEARLIESVRERMGEKPKWNKADGSKHGRELAIPPDFDLVEVLTGQSESFLVARSSLRELAANEFWEGFEEHLHAQRLEMLMGPSNHDDFELESRYPAARLQPEELAERDSYLTRPCRVANAT